MTGNFLLRKLFRGNLNDANSTNETASFRFKQRKFSSRGNGP